MQLIVTGTANSDGPYLDSGTLNGSAYYSRTDRFIYWKDNWYLSSVLDSYQPGDLIAVQAFTARENGPVGGPYNGTSGWASYSGTNPPTVTGTGSPPTPPTLPPLPPSAPTLNAVSANQIDVTTPGLTLGATSFDIQRSENQIIWLTIATNQGANTMFSDTGRTADTLYYYRVGAKNNGGTTYGTSASATTLKNAPAAPQPPTLAVLSQTEINSTQPALPAGADNFDLQRSTDNSTWATIATGLPPG